MWAVIDANSYFCSVERVFHPGLKGRPVCVLSSNDGIIVALTPEAKALGLRRGDPVFKVKNVIERYGVTVFSGNMMLYDAMSKRVVSIIRQAAVRVEQYSIDESFVDLEGYEQNYDLEAYMRSLSQRILLWTDIPVSVGVAPTKTLAKMGSKFAKDYPGYRSVCMIDNESKRRKALAIFKLEDVWGIGRRNFAKLRSLGVRTPLEFADKPAEWVHRHFPKPMFQTWNELNGRPCIDTAEIPERQSITTSRSFGEMIRDSAMLKASVASFTASCANKLRAQGSVARNIEVYLCSNPFRKDLPQYFNAASCTLPVPTSDTVELTSAAMRLVDQIYLPGILYKKSGVILGEISSRKAVQQDLFDAIDNRPQRLELSLALDRINRKFGLKTVALAVEGGEDRPWKVKSARRSPNCLTDISELMEVGK